MSAVPEPIEIPGRVTLRGWVWGDEASPIVLALHGWLDNAGTFSELAPRLSDYCVVAMDLPGHGLSDSLATAQSYHFNDHLQDIQAVLAALPGERFHLMGHSMGGALALMYAATFPGQVRSVTSIDALGPLGEPADRAASRLRKALEARSKPVPPGRVFPDREAAVGARVADRRLDPASAERLAERGLEKVQGGWRWNADRRHYWPSITRFTEEQILSLLRTVKAPVLLLLAEASQYKLPAQFLERRVAALSDVRVAELPGAHHLHLDHPEPCAAKIAAFLDALEHPERNPAP